MNIIIADSNELSRVGLKSVLHDLVKVCIVAEATTDEELNQLCDCNVVDQIIIDYTSEFFSIDIIPKILHKYPDIDVIAITPEQSATTLINALKSGVKSYVRKDCSLSEIKDAVVETGKGNNFFCGRVLNIIHKSEINVDDYSLEEFTCEPINLSNREVEIIKLIAEGLSNAKIAEELFLSNHTINTHRKNIMTKIGVKNTAGIVIYAVKMNLVSPKKFLFATKANELVAEKK